MPTTANVIELNPGEEPKFILAPLPIERRWIQEQIGDWDVCAFKIELPDHRWWLAGWVDDNGLVKQLPLNFLRWSSTGDPVVGKCIITREARDPSGKLAPANQMDMDLIKRMLMPHQLGRITRADIGSSIIETRILRPLPGMVGTV